MTNKTKEELIEEIKHLQKRITELETPDTELLQQQQQQMRRLSTVVLDSNDAITIQDFDGRITAWNHGAELMYGYSGEEALGMNIGLLTPSGKAAEQKEFTRRIMAGEAVSSLETQRVTKDGRILDVWLTVTKLVDDAGKPVGIASAERNITEHKRAEEGIIASEERYRRLFETAKDGILILNARTGMIADVNPFLVKMLGFTHEEFCGKKVWEIGLFKDYAANEVNFLKLQKKEYIRYEDMPLQTKDGRQINVEFVSNVYDVGEKKVIQCNIRDISDRKKLEQQLQSQNQALKTMNQKLQELNELESQFVSTASHELRTPLTVIMSAAYNLFDGTYGEMTELQKKWVEKIRHHSTRLKDLISNILDLSKLGSGKESLKKEWVEIGPWMGKIVSAMQSLENAKNLKITKKLPETLVKTYMDPSRIEQVLINLVTNAIKFSPEKGNIRLSVKRNDNEIQFTVSDEGAGIAPKYRKVIFDKFRQIKKADENCPYNKGIGLGLAICREIVHQHGGKIWVESKPGKGSQFKFQIPIEPPEISESKKKILVIDDEKEICNVLERILVEAGYQATSCSNGQDAISRFKDENGQVGYIILDLKLPGMQGPDIIREIRQLDQSVPFVIITAYPNSQLLYEAMSYGPLTVVGKPFSHADIINTVNRVFRNKNGCPKTDGSAVQ